MRGARASSARKATATFRPRRTASPLRNDRSTAGGGRLGGRASLGQRVRQQPETPLGSLLGSWNRCQCWHKPKAQSCSSKRDPVEPPTHSYRKPCSQRNGADHDPANPLRHSGFRPYGGRSQPCRGGAEMWRCGDEVWLPRHSNGAGVGALQWEAERGTAARRGWYPPGKRAILGRSSPPARARGGIPAGADAGLRHRACAYGERTARTRAEPDFLHLLTRAA